MSVLMRIYFIGLIAFVPSDSDRAMTILVLDARGGYAASDGQWVEPHQPMLVARADRCRGDCSTDHRPIADFLYRDLLVEAGGSPPIERLRQAIGGGAAWMLDNSDLLFRTISATTSRQPAGLRILRSKDVSSTGSSDSGAAGFDWVPKISHLDPAAAQIDPDVLSDRPRKQLIAARLSLSGGEIRAYDPIRDQPIDFRPLRSHDSSDVAHSQALPAGIVAEIELPGCSVEWIGEAFDEERRRSMILEVDGCEGADTKEMKVIEVAILNVPKSDFELAKRRAPATQRAGRHFEMYYELSDRRPPNHLRPVPHLRSPSATSEPYAASPQSSEFLGSVLSLPKGVISPPLCPGTEFSVGPPPPDI